MKQKKYSIIYADPPWTYRVYSSKGNGRSAANHYPVMELEAIKALPVEKLAEKDCILFLWVTFPNLRESFEVIESWGFTFKTVAFVWIKRNRKSDSLFWGMGYWTRANAEICLLATKGAPKRQSAGVHQVILSHIEEHSKKPAEARERIVELWGICLGLNCSQGRNPPDGMYGEMKWKVLWIWKNCRKTVERSSRRMAQPAAGKFLWRVILWRLSAYQKT